MAASCERPDRGARHLPAAAASSVLTWPRRKGSLTGAMPCGFTLLEVLVAVAILGLALVSLLGLHNQNLTIIARDQNITIASMLAQGLMAEIDARGYPEPGLEEGDFEKSWQGRFADFGWEREVSDLPVPGLREIRVSVFWGDDPERAVELFYYTRQGG